MVLIVETGISLIELDCRSLDVVISMRVVILRELIYVVGTVLTHQLVSIAVIFQLLLSMTILTETQSIYVGLYTGSGGMLLMCSNVF